MGLPEQNDPKDLPPETAELIDNIDTYQKRMENEWDSAKSAYQNKINQIMEEFLKQGFSVESPSKQNEKQTPPPTPERTEAPRVSGASKSTDPYIAKLLLRVDEELRETARKGPRIPSFSSGEASFPGLAWNPTWKQKMFMYGKKYFMGLLGFILLGGVIWNYATIPSSTPLPYTHTLGPIIVKNQIYILDWFRKSLFVHKLQRGFPLVAVENLPNTLATGLAFDAKVVWSLDGIDGKILKHSTTPDHQVLQKFETPGKKPIGLFFDGTDLWSIDVEQKKLFHHRGNDIEDLKDEFLIPDSNVTSFQIRNGRVWILDGSARILSVCRLQKPLKILGAFDLDPFVKGATPTGFTVEGSHVWILTENPSRLNKISLRKIQKSQVNVF